MAFTMSPQVSQCFTGSKQAPVAPRRAAPVVSFGYGTVASDVWIHLLFDGG